MGSKFRPKKFLLSISIIAILFVGVGITVTDNESFGTLLDVPPNAIVTIVGDDGENHQVEIGDFDEDTVACWIENVLLVRNQAGEFKDEIRSSTLKVNPTQANSLIDSSKGFVISGEKGGFAVNPRIQCTVAEGKVQDPNAFALFGAFPEESNEKLTLPIVIESGNLVVRMYSNDNSVGGGERDIFHDTFHGEMKIVERELYTTEPKGIGLLEISDNTIIRWMKDGDYYSKQTITIDGIITLHFKCSGACGEKKIVIPLSTQRDELTDKTDPFYGTNNWANIENPMKVHNTLHVVKNTVTTDIVGTVIASDQGEGTPEEGDTGVNPFIDDAEGDPTCQNPNETWNGSICTTQVERDCEALGMIPFGNQCIIQGQVGNTTVTPTTGGTDIFSQLSICISSGNPTCLTNPTFLPLWIGGVGFIVLIGALAQSSPVQRRTTDIYGVPSGY